MTFAELIAARTLAQVTIEEGFRREAYDDAQPGIALKPGVTLKGVVTIGHGLTWITEAESRALVLSRLEALTAALVSALPWFERLSSTRQGALVDMAYNLGLAGLQGFTTFLLLLQDGKFAEAADDLATTKWHGQVGNRALRIETQIRSG